MAKKKAPKEKPAAAPSDHIPSMPRPKKPKPVAGPEGGTGSTVPDLPGDAPTASPGSATEG